MARTQAVYYRDSRGAEPVGEFIQALPPKRAAKIDDFVEEHLNGQPPATGRRMARVQARVPRRAGPSGPCADRDGRV